jgi:hypothetical protein
MFDADGELEGEGQVVQKVAADFGAVVCEYFCLVSMEVQSLLVLFVCLDVIFDCFSCVA